ncbi:MAG: hypothetical protein OEY55_10255 [Acidimicrobiia bacterium]|nr:hypothetical protein [Acidimicrobiia bacterium]
MPNGQDTSLGPVYGRQSGGSHSESGTVVEVVDEEVVDEVELVDVDEVVDEDVVVGDVIVVAETGTVVVVEDVVVEDVVVDDVVVDDVVVLPVWHAKTTSCPELGPSIS